MEKKKKPTIPVIVIAGQLVARLEIGRLLPNETRGHRIASLKQLQIIDPDYRVTIHVRGQSPREARLRELDLDPHNESENHKPSIDYTRVMSGISIEEARALRNSQPPALPSAA